MAVSGSTTPTDPDDRLDDTVRACLTSICDGVTAEANDLQALPDDLIQAIEDDQPVPIAYAYRCFLKATGGGAGKFLQGSDVFHPDVLGIRASAQELLAENGLALEDTDRVILMHRGTQFDFTRGLGHDPEVWSYSEGDTPTRAFDTFTDWLRANATEQTQAWTHLSSWQALTGSVKNQG